MVKRLFASLLLALPVAMPLSLLPMATAQAECVNLGSNTCGAATSYEITIEKVEFCKSSSCANAVVVASSSSEFDIAASSAGAAVGNYADLDGVAAGVYTHVRTTIDGSISYGAPATGACSAVSAGTSQDVTTITGISTALQSSANSDFNLSVSGSDLIHLYELNRALTISKAGSLPQVQIDFSTADGHICLGGVSYPGVPYVSIKVFDN